MRVHGKTRFGLVALVTEGAPGGKNSRDGVPADGFLVRGRLGPARCPEGDEDDRERGESMKSIAWHGESPGDEGEVAIVVPGRVAAPCGEENPSLLRFGPGAGAPRRRRGVRIVDTAAILVTEEDES